MFNNKQKQLVIILISLLLTFTSQASLASDTTILNEIINPQLIHIYEWETLSVYEKENVSQKPANWDSAESFYGSTRLSLLGEERFYRAKFTIGWHHRTRNLAISVGPLKGTDEVYINGFRVDDSGSGDYDLFFQNSYRVYRLPRNKTWFSWFNYTKENELLIKLSSSKRGQVLDSDYVEIGDYETLALKSRDFDSTIKTSQGSAIALLFMLILFIIFLHVNQYNKKSNTLFGFFIFYLSLSIASTSLFLNGPEYDGELLLSLSACLDLVSLVVFIKIVSDKFDLNISHYKRNEKSIKIFGTVSVLCILIFSDIFFAQKWFNLIIYIVMLLVVISTIHQLVIGRNIGGANYSIVSALMIMFLGVAFNGLWGGNSWPISPYHIGAILSSIFLLYSIAQDFKKMTLSMHAMSSRLVNIREIERARLTRDIHDGVGQGLATIRLFITMNINNFEPQLGISLKNEVDQTSNTLKSVIRNLKPIEMDDGNPSEAIIELARHLCEIAQIEMKVIHSDKADMNTENAYQLYRIGQEALNNSIKHSCCTLITIDIQRDRDRLIMSISDNGKGIKKQVENLGYGLSSMQERALLIGGQLRINNAIDSGVQVFLEVPIND
ncbi:sensor histidine kinase [Colwellia psychrerythraea]|uniref:Sensor histidine kinase n=1 Tax=Colwellia psychrerythraea (strain 34H / ATCC BAA-681) TaxID=167879 RepID=Q483K6_COLP3|nr:sensor histidine kinase [Colwellia psychrerythraea]AAZ25071.1 sensor histidine kinase [Colwellia psychrerythraea 34H]